METRHAGSQPLNINMGPSFAREARVTPIVDLIEVSVTCGRSISKTRLTLDPGPEAFMIRLFRTSAVSKRLLQPFPDSKFEAEFTVNEMI